VGLDLSGGAYVEILPSGVVSPTSFASYTRDQNLGMLGTEQTGWHWPRGLDAAVSNSSGSSPIQVLGFAPV